MSLSATPPNITTQATQIQQENAAEAVLALEVPKSLPPPANASNVLLPVASRTLLLKIKKKGTAPVLSDPNASINVCQLLQEDKSNGEGLVTANPNVKKLQSSELVKTVSAGIKSKDSEIPTTSTRKGSQSNRHERLMNPAEKMNLCQNLELKVTTPGTTAAVMGEWNDNVLVSRETDYYPCQSSGKIEDQGLRILSIAASLGMKSQEDYLDANVDRHAKNSLVRIQNTDDTGRHLIADIDKNCKDSRTRIDGSDTSVGSEVTSVQLLKSHYYRRIDSEDKNNVGPVGIEKTVTENGVREKDHWDRNFRQKGPRMAKVVRRISCNVEPLEYGSIVPEKAWCNSEAIYPVGMLLNLLNQHAQMFFQSKSTYNYLPIYCRLQESD